MATQQQMVTSTPAPLIGIVTGKRYYLQNSGSSNNLPSTSGLRVDIQASAAAVGIGFILKFGEGQPVSVQAGESVFVWHGGDEPDFFVVYDVVA